MSKEYPVGSVWQYTRPSRRRRKMTVATSISPAEVRVGDYITVTGFRTDGEGVVSRIEVTKRHVDRAGVQEDYVFYKRHVSVRGVEREVELARCRFGYLMTIQRFN